MKRSFGFAQDDIGGRFVRNGSLGARAIELASIGGASPTLRASSPIGVTVMRDLSALRVRIFNPYKALEHFKIILIRLLILRRRSKMGATAKLVWGCLRSRHRTPSSCA